MGRLTPPPSPEGWVTCYDDEYSDATQICETAADAVAKWISDVTGYQRLVDGLEEGETIEGIALAVFEAGFPWHYFNGLATPTLEMIRENIDPGDLDPIAPLLDRGDSLDQLNDDITQAFLRHIVRVKGKLSLDYWEGCGKHLSVTLTPEQMTECRKMYGEE